MLIPTNIKSNHCKPSHQHGSALVVGLLILLVLTIIGTTALNNSVLEEKMSGNFQRETIAFQNTETAMNQMFYRAAQDRIIQDPNGGGTIRENITSTAIDAGLNVWTTPPNNVFNSADGTSNGTTQVRWAGAGVCPGLSRDIAAGFKCARIQIESTGRSANATVSHTLNADKALPNPEASGN